MKLRLVAWHNIAKESYKIPLCLSFILGVASLFSPRVFAEKRALLVGIGDYDTQTTGWRKIHGDADVSLLTPLLKQQGFSVQSLVNKEATKSNILKILTKFSNSVDSEDEVFILFSVHGQLVKDFNGDEAAGLDQAIIAYDALRSEGYARVPMTYKGENHLLDDELAPFLQTIGEKAGEKGFVFVAFDACYSRGLERGGENEDLPEDLPEFMRGTDEVFSPTDPSYLYSIPYPAKFSHGCPMIVVSASEENERNFEVKVGNHYYGSLSYCIALLLKKKLPIADWTTYFRSGQYKTSGCFKPYQHPSITIYK